MIDLRDIFICAGINITKSMCKPKIYTVAAMILAFYSYHLSGLSKLCSALNTLVSPWILPHIYTTPLVLVLNGFFLTALFSDLPMMDAQAYFIIFRIKRGTWVSGQIMYIILMSLLFVLYTFFVTVISLFPNVEWTCEWGILIRTLAVNASTLSARTGVILDVGVEKSILDTYNGIDATIVSLGLLWLVSCFAGVLILCLNTLTHAKTGVIVSGIFSYMCFFGHYQGTVMLGRWVAYISPYSWVSINSINWTQQSGIAPPQSAYIFCTLAGCSVFLSLLYILLFFKQDFACSG